MSGDDALDSSEDGRCSGVMSGYEATVDLDRGRNAREVRRIEGDELEVRVDLKESESLSEL